MTPQVCFDLPRGTAQYTGFSLHDKID
jgi:hypothetical protein